MLRGDRFAYANEVAVFDNVDLEDIGASKSLCAVRLPHAMVPVYALG